MALPQLDIDRLSAEERIQLADELWDSLSDRPEEIPLTPVQEVELDRRLKAFQLDRDPGEPWREALAKIGKGELSGRCSIAVRLS
jgi:putative addiction module component (TIGR02574 family)